MPSRPGVSVVIPTRGRPDRVLSAVQSVLRQSYPVLEVIVVIDGPDAQTVGALSTIGDERLRVIELAESRRAGGARNAGVQAASGEWVAFLDDDDLWREDKLLRQMELTASRSDASDLVVSCQAYWDVGGKVAIWPTRGIGPDEGIGDYLFVRRRAGEGTMATPTLLLPTALAKSVPMPEHLRTHEEWDWLLQLERAGASFATVLLPLADIDARPRRASVSDGASWRDSLSWALSRQELLGPRPFSGFVLTEVARAAARTGAGWRTHVALLAVACSGDPTLVDLARFVGRLLVAAVRRPGGVRCS